MSLLASPRRDRPLHDHQREAIEKLRESYRKGKKRPVMMAPTGTGKTRIAGEITSLMEKRDKKVVFTVPRIDLIDQTLESFYADGITGIGVIQANHAATDWSQPIQIASVQTLTRRGFPDADLVIVDEAHLAFETIYRWQQEKPETPFLGLTATPWTRGMGQEGRYDDLIVCGTTAEMIDKGYLSDFKVFAPSHPDLSGVHTKMGDYVEGELSLAMNKSPLVADVVKTWLERAEWRPTLLFAVDRAHAKHLQERFTDAGVPTGYQDAHTSMHDRAMLRRSFHDGTTRVVCSVGTLTTGVDWDVRCIVMARPTKSEILYTQIFGRGLRTAPGKDHCLFLDHSDTTLRLGFVTDIFHDSLDDGRERGKQERAEALPKECPQCAFLRPPRVAACPNCGFKPQPAVNRVEHQAGELHEWTRADGARLMMDRNKKIKIKDEIISREDFYAQLLTYQAQKGYKPGYAGAKFKDATGGWPPRDWQWDINPQPVSFGVHLWLRQQAQRWALAHRR